jgi:hypothetical protein
LHPDPAQRENAIMKYMEKYFEESSDIIRSLVYPDWNLSKFQAFKPVPVPEFDGKQKDYWLEVRPEMIDMKHVWRHYWRSYIDKINPIYLHVNKEFKKSRTRLHYLGNID